MNKSILEELLVAETETQPLTGVVIGHLVALGAGNEPLVDYAGNPAGEPLRAVTTTPLQSADIGREFALMFENGDGTRPLVIGPLVRPGGSPATGPDTGATPPEPKVSEAVVDGERVTFSATEEIVLKCGAASITLTRAGKILIRGKYVLSRSSGVNRIKGGSIQLN